MSEITSIAMGNQYNDVILLDEYNGQISIVSAREGKDGKTYPQWVFPQDKDRQPREKAIPLKVTLGDRQQAAAVLRQLAAALDGTPVSTEAPGDWDDGSDVPF